MRLTRALLPGMIVVAAVLPSIAADAKISDLRFGEAIVGPKLKPDDLKGHVVLVELWGIR